MTSFLRSAGKLQATGGTHGWQTQLEVYRWQSRRSTQQYLFWPCPVTPRPNSAAASAASQNVAQYILMGGQTGTEQTIKVQA